MDRIMYLWTNSILMWDMPAGRYSHAPTHNAQPLLFSQTHENILISSPSPPSLSPLMDCHPVRTYVWAVIERPARPLIYILTNVWLLEYSAWTRGGLVGRSVRRDGRGEGGGLVSEIRLIESVCDRRAIRDFETECPVGVQVSRCLSIVFKFWWDMWSGS